MFSSKCNISYATSYLNYLVTPNMGSNIHKEQSTQKWAVPPYCLATNKNPPIPYFIIKIKIKWVFFLKLDACFMFSLG